MVTGKRSERPLKQQLIYRINPQYPHFQKQYEVHKPAEFLSFEPMDCKHWYESQVERLISMIGLRRHFPVYRMGHGEYIMAIGRQHARAWYTRDFRQNVSYIYHKYLKREFRSGSQGYGYEEYTRAELREVRRIFLECVKAIASDGMLALALYDSPAYQAYIPLMLEWLDQHNISLTPTNYLDVYTIYALMHGPDHERLLQGRRILIVTNFNDEKRAAITARLRKVGVADVQFLWVSRNKAMRDQLDLGSVTQPVDVALVAAGVGSANILIQLKPLQTLCLDVGFAVDTLANPVLRWKRPFCVPDDEFD